MISLGRSRVLRQDIRVAAGLVAAGFKDEGCGLYLAREGGIALAEGECEALHAGEGREEALTDTADDMLQEARGNSHLGLDDLVDVGIADGLLQLVTADTPSYVSPESELDDELIADTLLLWEDAVVGVEAHFVQGDLHCFDLHWLIVG